MKIAVAVSGSGRSLENLIKNSTIDDVFSVAFVFASKAGIRAIDIAEQNNIPHCVLDFSPEHQYRSSDKIFQICEQNNISLLVLAGFLKKIILPDSWSYKCINIHPALLPKFGGKGMYGMTVHEAVIESRESTSGATVHFVNNNYDEGQIISQIIVPIEPDETPGSLAQKVFDAECQLLPQTVRLFGTKQINPKLSEIIKLEFKYK